MAAEFNSSDIHHRAIHHFSMEDDEVARREYETNDLGLEKFLETGNYKTSATGQWGPCPDECGNAYFLLINSQKALACASIIYTHCEKAF